MTLLLKSISWRVVATLSFVITTYVKTGDIKAALDLGLWASVVNALLYYVHELAWRKK
jgi:uncharacterized membrane protein